MRRRESPTDSDLGPKAVNGREMRVSSSRAMMKWWLMPLFVCVCVRCLESRLQPPTIVFRC